EFLEDTGEGTLGEAKHCRLQQQSRTVMIAGWVVEVGQAPGSKTAQDARVVHLPALVVAFADHGVGERVGNARRRATCALVDVSGVLFEQRWIDRAADEGTGEDVGIGRAKTLAVSLQALTIAGKIVG